MSPNIETTELPETTSFTDVLSNKDQVRQKRLEEFESNISQQLQQCLTAAASAKNSANSAKTNTKRRFYNKKFAKITAEAKQAIVALQQIKALTEKVDDVATSTT